MHRFDQRRRFRFPGNQGRARVATRFQVTDMIHPQATLLLRAAVTFKAAFHQNGPHFLLKKRHRHTLCLIVRR